MFERLYSLMFSLCGVKERVWKSSFDLSGCSPGCYPIEILVRESLTCRRVPISCWVRMDPKCTLGQVQLRLVLSKNSKGFPLVLDVLPNLKAFHKHVVNIYLYNAADLLLEHFIH